MQLHFDYKLDGDHDRFKVFILQIRGAELRPEYNVYGEVLWDAASQLFIFNIFFLLGRFSEYGEVTLDVCMPRM